MEGLVLRLASAGVRSLISQSPTLEELFLRLYADEIPGEGDGSQSRP